MAREEERCEFTQIPQLIKHQKGSESVTKENQDGTGNEKNNSISSLYVVVVEKEGRGPGGESRDPFRDRGKEGGVMSLIHFCREGLGGTPRGSQ